MSLHIFSGWGKKPCAPQATSHNLQCDLASGTKPKPLDSEGEDVPFAQLPDVERLQEFDTWQGCAAQQEGERVASLDTIKDREATLFKLQAISSYPEYCWIRRLEGGAIIVETFTRISWYRGVEQFILSVLPNTIPCIEEADQVGIRSDSPKFTVPMKYSDRPKKLKDYIDIEPHPNEGKPMQYELKTADAFAEPKVGLFRLLHSRILSIRTQARNGVPAKPTRITTTMAQLQMEAILYCAEYPERAAELMFPIFHVGQKSGVMERKKWAWNMLDDVVSWGDGWGEAKARVWGKQMYITYGNPMGGSSSSDSKLVYLGSYAYQTQQFVSGSGPNNIPMYVATSRTQLDNPVITNNTSIESPVSINGKVAWIVYIIPPNLTYLILPTVMTGSDASAQITPNMVTNSTSQGYRVLHNTITTVASNASTSASGDTDSTTKLYNMLLDEAETLAMTALGDGTASYVVGSALTIAATAAEAVLDFFGKLTRQFIMQHTSSGFILPKNDPNGFSKILQATVNKRAYTYLGNVSTSLDFELDGGGYSIFDDTYVPAQHSNYYWLLELVKDDDVRVAIHIASQIIQPDNVKEGTRAVTLGASTRINNIPAAVLHVAKDPEVKAVAQLHLCAEMEAKPTVHLEKSEEEAIIAKRQKTKMTQSQFQNMLARKEAHGKLRHSEPKAKPIKSNLVEATKTAKPSERTAAVEEQDTLHDSRIGPLPDEDIGITSSPVAAEKKEADQVGMVGTDVAITELVPILQESMSDYGNIMIEMAKLLHIPSSRMRLVAKFVENDVPQEVCLSLMTIYDKMYKRAADGSNVAEAIMDIMAMNPHKSVERNLKIAAVCVASIIANKHQFSSLQQFNCREANEAYTWCKELHMDYGQAFYEHVKVLVGEARAHNGLMHSYNGNMALCKKWDEAKEPIIDGKPKPQQEIGEFDPFKFVLATRNIINVTKPQDEDANYYQWFEAGKRTRANAQVANVKSPIPVNRLYMLEYTTAGNQVNYQTIFQPLRNASIVGAAPGNAQCKPGWETTATIPYMNMYKSQQETVANLARRSTITKSGWSLFDYIAVGQAQTSLEADTKFRDNINFDLLGLKMLLIREIIQIMKFEGGVAPGIRHVPLLFETSRVIEYDTTNIIGATIGSSNHALSAITQIWNFRLLGAPNPSIWPYTDDPAGAAVADNNNLSLHCSFVSIPNADLTRVLAAPQDVLLGTTGFPAGFMLSMLLALVIEWPWAATLIKVNGQEAGTGGAPGNGFFVPMWARTRISGLRTVYVLLQRSQPVAADAANLPTLVQVRSGPVATGTLGANVQILVSTQAVLNTYNMLDFIRTWAPVWNEQGWVALYQNLQAYIPMKQIVEAAYPFYAAIATGFNNLDITTENAAILPGARFAQNVYPNDWQGRYPTDWNIYSTNGSQFDAIHATHQLGDLATLTLVKLMMRTHEVVGYSPYNFTPLPRWSTRPMFWPALSYYAMGMASAHRAFQRHMFPVITDFLSIPNLVGGNIGDTMIEFRNRLYRPNNINEPLCDSLLNCIEQSMGMVMPVSSSGFTVANWSIDNVQFSTGFIDNAAALMSDKFANPIMPDIWAAICARTLPSGFTLNFWNTNTMDDGVRAVTEKKRRFDNGVVGTALVSNFDLTDDITDQSLGVIPASDAWNSRFLYYVSQPTGTSAMMNRQNGALALAGRIAFNPPLYVDVFYNAYLTGGVYIGDYTMSHASTVDIPFFDGSGYRLVATKPAGSPGLIAQSNVFVPQYYDWWDAGGIYQQSNMPLSVVRNTTQADKMLELFPKRSAAQPPNSQSASTLTDKI